MSLKRKTSRARSRRLPVRFASPTRRKVCGIYRAVLGGNELWNVLHSILKGNSRGAFLLAPEITEQYVEQYVKQTSIAYQFNGEDGAVSGTVESLAYLNHAQRYVKDNKYKFLAGWNIPIDVHTEQFNCLKIMLLKRKVDGKHYLYVKPETTLSDTYGHKLSFLRGKVLSGMPDLVATRLGGKASQKRCSNDKLCCMDTSDVVQRRESWKIPKGINSSDEYIVKDINVGCEVYLTKDDFEKLRGRKRQFAISKLD